MAEQPPTGAQYIRIDWHTPLVSPPHHSLAGSPVRLVSLARPTHFRPRRSFVPCSRLFPTPLTRPHDAQPLLVDATVVRQASFCSLLALQCFVHIFVALHPRACIAPAPIALS